MSVTGKTKPDGIMDAAITTVMDQVKNLSSVAAQYRRELSTALSDIQKVNVTPIDPPQRMLPLKYPRRM